MEEHQETSFIFEIDNFSEKKAPISSPIFTSGRCKWFVKVFPRRYSNKGYVFMYLEVANNKSLRLGWKRKACYSFIMLNESGKELNRASGNHLFCTEVLAWYYHKMFDEEDCLVNNKLIVKVEIKVSEVVHYGDETATEMVDFNGFQILQTQVSSVKRIFKEHPKVAVGFKPKSELVKTAYMNVLLGLIESLKKHPLSLSLTEISNADSDLTELTEAGFKLDWLKSKLDKLFLKMKKSYDVDGYHQVQQLEGCVKNLELMNSNDADGHLVQKLEERVKNLELMKLDFKLNCLKTKLEEVSLERKKSNDADRPAVQQLEERVKNLELKTSDDASGSRVQQLEERVKKIELKEMDFKLDFLKSKLVEVCVERKASDDASGSRVQQLEERVNNIELRETDFKLDFLKSKLAEVTLEKKTSDDANRSRVQELEERFNNLELIVGDLKVELDNKKAKSCDDGFLLVN